ncbi:SDR family oxidoreductase [Kaistia soli]|uniref:SDR family oxidoreductase n=1 Tax=Kaistia soli TaxID=446684 RepID=UPI003CC7ECD6
MHEGFGDRSRYSRAVRTALIAPIPLGRMARLGEVVAAALFLLSNEASFIAGVALCVDGGIRARRRVRCCHPELLTLFAL